VGKYYVIIPDTRRVIGLKSVEGSVSDPIKYMGRRKRFRPHKVYKFLIRITSRVNLAGIRKRFHKVYIFYRITSRVDPAMSVSPSVRDH